MDTNLLIEWMTHRGGGRWDSFKTGVEIVYNDADAPPSPFRIVDDLTTLGVAEFFIRGTARWRVFTPLLAGLVESSQAIMAGGRTAPLMSALADACVTEEVELAEVVTKRGHRQYRLSAPGIECLARVADRVDLPFVPGASERLCQQVQTMGAQLNGGQPVDAPHNWKVESFDLSTLSWVVGDLGATAKKFTPTRGVPRYMVTRQDGAHIEMERRAAVYAAAYGRSISLMDYDSASSTLSVPNSAQLPGDLARAAALCNGALPLHRGGRALFEGVPWSVASMLLALTGQPLPITPAEPTGARP